MFNQLQHKIRQQQARQWFLKLQDDSAVRADTFYRFNCWLEKPENEKAYQSVEQTWNALGQLSHTTEGQLLRRHAKAQSQQGSLLTTLSTLVHNRFLHASIAATCSVICFALVFAFYIPSKSITQEYTTAATETRELTLDDGSLITLTPKTNILVTFEKHQRSVALTNGHAFFDITKDNSRPFTVKHNKYTVKVTGTAFSINTKRDEFSVMVDEGHVVVEDIKNSAESNHLSAGQAIQARNGSLGEISQGHSNQLSLWKRGVLVYRDVALDQILAETNTYTLQQIFPATTQLGKTQISLSINISQLDELPSILEALLPIKAVKAEYGKIMLVSQP